MVIKLVIYSTAVYKTNKQKKKEKKTQTLQQQKQKQIGTFNYLENILGLKEQKGMKKVRQ